MNDVIKYNHSYITDCIPYKIDLYLQLNFVFEDQIEQVVFPNYPTFF